MLESKNGWQWCWWHRYLGDIIMLMTLWWWLISDVGDFLNVLNCSPTSQTSNQYIWSLTSVTNIDVIHSYRVPRGRHDVSNKFKAITGTFNPYFPVQVVRTPWNPLLTLNKPLRRPEFILYLSVIIMQKLKSLMVRVLWKTLRSTLNFYAVLRNWWSFWNQTYFHFHDKWFAVES